MLRTLFPRYHPRYEQSCCSEELEAFGVWLMAGGYSRQNTIGHLRRFRQAFERHGEAGADTVYSDRRLKELFVCPGVSASQAIDYRATRRAYRRFLATCGRFQAVPLSERRRFIEEYGRFLRKVRGFARSTITQHVSTVSGFLEHALGPTDSLATLNADHVERYLSMKSAQVTRQSLQHTVAHLRGFLAHAHDNRLIPIRLDTIDTPRTYRGERPPRAMPTARPAGVLHRGTQTRPARPLHRLDGGATREEPPKGDRQCPLPHPALDPNPQPGLSHPVRRVSASARTLDRALQHHARVDRNVRGNPALHRRHLQSLRLDPGRRHPGARTLRPVQAIRQAEKGHLASTSAQRLETKAEPLKSLEYPLRQLAPCSALAGRAKIVLIAPSVPS